LIGEIEGEVGDLGVQGERANRGALRVPGYDLLRRRAGLRGYTLRESRGVLFQ
jgi:hypothetical protein